jgi:hypothetical protein
MPRGSRIEVSAYERGRWLEDLEKGRGITEIAKAAGRDIRVVKRHLEIGREERALAQARHEFIRSRLELHQEDLLADARRIRDRLARLELRSLEPGNPLHTKIHQGFKEHCRRVLLGRLLGRWEDEVRGFIQTCNSVRHELEVEEVKISTRLPAGLELYPGTPTAMAHLEGSVRAGKLVDTKCEPSPSADGAEIHVRRGEHLLTVRPIDPTLYGAVEQAYGELWGLATRSFEPLRALHEGLQSLANQIVDELDVLILRRYVPGRCLYCPA